MSVSFLQVSLGFPPLLILLFPSPKDKATSYEWDPNDSPKALWNSWALNSILPTGITGSPEMHMCLSKGLHGLHTAIRNSYTAILSTF